MKRIDKFFKKTNIIIDEKHKAEVKNKILDNYKFEEKKKCALF